MSYPANPLSVYRSYSYYHVLVMCDNSVTADRLAQSTTVGHWMHPNGIEGSLQYDLLGKYAPKQLVAEEGGGQYVVLINGAEDAQLSIDRASWFATVAGEAVQGDRANSMATEGSIAISEAAGCVFLDVLILAAMSLGTDMSATTFLLKTFFVGHGTSASRGDFTETRTEIEPLRFHLVDAKAKFTEAGGFYNLEIVGMANGITRSPTYSRVGAGLKLALADPSSDSGVSLQAAITALEQKVQSLYEQQYNRVVKTVQNAVQVSGTGDNLLKQLTGLRYHLTIDDMYDESYIVTDAPSAYKNKGLCSEGVYVDEGANASIESMIIKIMNMCPKVKEDAATGTTQSNQKFSPGTKLQYKIKSSVRTSPTAEGELQFDVYYHIAPYVSAVDVPVDLILQSDTDTADKQRLRDSVIEFDYVYTGNNTDVLKFEMDLNSGFSYLQIASQSNTFSDQLEIATSRSTQIPNLANDAARFGTPAKVPVPFGAQLDSRDLINTQYPAATTQAAYTINKASSMDVAESTIEIVGNPLLLNTINRGSRTDIESLRAPPEQSVVDAGATTTDTSDLRLWGHFPVFAKINVNMPARSDFEGLYAGSAGDFTRPFWYQGYFNIITIENVFDQGYFTQNLGLIMLPEDLGTPRDRRLRDDFQAALKTQVRDSFDNTFNIPVDQNSKSVAQPAVRDNPETGQPDPSPATTPDQTSNIDAQSQTDPSIVKGWSKASSEVQDAIKQAAARYGTDLVTMAMFAYKESGFRPTAKAPGSSATGLYQHIDGTWYDLVKRGQIHGVSSSISKAESLPLRTVPLLSCNGGAAYINQVRRTIGSDNPGDIYLGYFSGPGTAKKIVSACNNSPGTTLAQAVGAKLASQMSAANPSIVKPNMTCCEMREWARKAMNSTLIKGVSVPTPVNDDSKGQVDPNASTAKPPVGVDANVGGTAPITQPNSSRSAAEALAATVDPAIVDAQINKEICGSQKIPDVDVSAPIPEPEELNIPASRLGPTPPSDPFYKLGI